MARPAARLEGETARHQRASQQGQIDQGVGGAPLLDPEEPGGRQGAAEQPPRKGAARADLDEPGRREECQHDGGRGEECPHDVQRCAMQRLGGVLPDPSSDSDEGVEGDGDVDQQQHLPGRHAEDEASHRGADGQPDQPDGRDDGHRAHASGFLVEQPVGQRHGTRSRHGCGDPHQPPQGDQLLRRGDQNGRGARGGQQGQPDQHHAAASESVGQRAEQQHEASEGDGVAAGHPLQRRGRRGEVASDGGKRHREDRVVEHFDQEDRRERAEGKPGRS